MDYLSPRNSTSLSRRIVPLLYGQYHFPQNVSKLTIQGHEDAWGLFALWQFVTYGTQGMRKRAKTNTES